MTLEFTTELYWLTLVAILTGLLWVPYIMQLAVQLGPIGAMWDPTGAHPHDQEWALRAKRAHYNAIENLAVFAPLTLMVVATGAVSGLTAGAAVVYFWARLVQYVVHVMAVPVVRTVAFLVGVGCQAVMALALLGFG